jgi:hypothetical protein
VINKLLKFKYHATDLGRFTYSQLDKILNKVARNAPGLTSSFSTEAIQRLPKVMGLGYAPLKEKRPKWEYNT